MFKWVKMYDFISSPTWCFLNLLSEKYLEAPYMNIHTNNDCFDESLYRLIIQIRNKHRVIMNIINNYSLSVAKYLEGNMIRVA